MTDAEMSRKEKGKALEKRTRQFAVQMIELVGELANTEAGKVVKNQMVISGTSVGANYREAADDGGNGSGAEDHCLNFK